jgi:hypothetical protein
MLFVLKAVTGNYTEQCLFGAGGEAKSVTTVTVESDG